MCQLNNTWHNWLIINRAESAELCVCVLFKCRCTSSLRLRSELRPKGSILSHSGINSTSIEMLSFNIKCNKLRATAYKCFSITHHAGFACQQCLGTIQIQSHLHQPLMHLNCPWDCFWTRITWLNNPVQQPTKSELKSNHCSYVYPNQQP